MVEFESVPIIIKTIISIYLLYKQVLNHIWFRRKKQIEKYPLCYIVWIFFLIFIVIIWCGWCCSHFTNEQIETQRFINLNKVTWWMLFSFSVIFLVFYSTDMPGFGEAAMTLSDMILCPHKVNCLVESFYLVWATFHVAVTHICRVLNKIFLHYYLFYDSYCSFVTGGLDIIDIIPIGKLKET